MVINITQPKEENGQGNKETDSIDKNLNSVEDQLQKAIAPVEPPKQLIKINVQAQQADLLGQTAKKAVAVKHKLNQVGESLGQVVDSLGVNLSPKVEAPIVIPEKPKIQFSLDAKSMMDFGKATEVHPTIVET